MADKRNGNIVYALSGRTLEAAKQLERELAKELETVPVKTLGNMKEIGDSWDAMYRGLLVRLEKEAPEILVLTGLKAPTTQVFKGPQSLPRAYNEYPQIFLSPEKEPRYFMYVPVDYRGRHFMPLDSKRLNDKEEAKVGDLLFAGGWLGNAPIVTVKKRGVATPADYVAPDDAELRKSAGYAVNDQVIFLPAGRSLELVQDYRARTEDWKAKIDAAREEIEKEVIKRKGDVLAFLPPGEDVKPSISYRYSSGGGDKVQLLLSVRREGKDNLWHAGKAVNPPLSPAYTLEAQEYGGEFIVTPNRATPEGRKIAALIDAIPLTPGLGDYPELRADYSVHHDDITKMLGVNGEVPYALDVAGITVLRYMASPDARKDFCPPDAKPFPTEAYEWLRSDEGDKNMGIEPPPMHKDVADILSSVKKPAKSKTPAPK